MIELVLFGTIVGFIASFFGVANFIEETCYRLSQIELHKEEGMYKVQVKNSVFRGEYYELLISVNVNDKEYLFTIFDYNDFHTLEEFYISLKKEARD